MILVIKAQDVEVANNWMKETVDPQGGEFTFTLPLYDATGSIVYYWCSINLPEEDRADMDFFFAPLIFECTPQEVLSQLNVTTSFGDEND